MKALKVILSLVLILTFIFSFSGCLKYTGNILEVTNSAVTETTTQFPIITTTQPAVENTTQMGIENTTQPVIENTTLPVVENTTLPVVETTTLPVVETTTQAVVDPSSWTKAEVLSALTDAVAKTKAYKGNITAGHVENFDAEITDITGGSLVASVANNLIASVAKPVNETLTFSNGTAVNSEGETTQLLLPMDGPFTLPLAGVATATASKSGNNIVIKITLVEENCGMYDPPVYNAASIGYISLDDVDLGIVTLSGGSIYYHGSTIEATINSNGYVSKCEYTIPVSIEGTGSAMGISAHVAFDGAQYESWTVNW